MTDKQYMNVEERMIKGKPVRQKQFIEYLSHDAVDMIHPVFTELININDNDEERSIEGRVVSHGED